MCTCTSTRVLNIILICATLTCTYVHIHVHMYIYMYMCTQTGRVPDIIAGFNLLGVGWVELLSQNTATSPPPPTPRLSCYKHCTSCLKPTNFKPIHCLQTELPPKRKVLDRTLYICTYCAMLTCTCTCTYMSMYMYTCTCTYMITFIPVNCWKSCRNTPMSNLWWE